MFEWMRRNSEPSPDTVTAEISDPQQPSSESGVPYLQAFDRYDKENGELLTPDPSPQRDSSYPAGYLHNPEDT